MNKEAFTVFIEDLCSYVGSPVYFSWKDGSEGSQSPQLVSQLLDPKVAESLLTQLHEEQESVEFTLVTPSDDPEYRKLAVSEDSIKKIDEAIVARLNITHKLPSGYEWQQFLSLTQKPCIGVNLGFSVQYNHCEENEDRVVNHLIRLPKELELRYGIKSEYEYHKRGDMFLLTEVSYAAYKNLFITPNLVHALLAHSILNSEPQAVEDDEAYVAHVGKLLS